MMRVQTSIPAVLHHELPRGCLYLRGVDGHRSGATSTTLPPHSNNPPPNLLRPGLLAI